MAAATGTARTRNFKPSKPPGPEEQAELQATLKRLADTIQAAMPPEGERSRTPGAPGDDPRKLMLERLGAIHDRLPERQVVEGGHGETKQLLRTATEQLAITAEQLGKAEDHLRAIRPKPQRPWARMTAWVGATLGVVGTLTGVIAFFMDFESKVSQRTLNAWQTLASPLSGNAGRGEALQYLNRYDGVYCTDAVRAFKSLPALGNLLEDPGSPCLVTLKEPISFRNLDLNGESNLIRVHLKGVKLPKADLWTADLARANMDNAQLQNADLRHANLSDVSLREAGLQEARLKFADFSGSNLRCANLIGAHFEGATLDGAFVSGAVFSDEGGGRAYSLSQEQLARTWAWADDPPEGLERLGLEYPADRLCQREQADTCESPSDSDWLLLIQTRASMRAPRYTAPPGCGLG